jgi:hypothetical protein
MKRRCGPFPRFAFHELMKRWQGCRAGQFGMPELATDFRRNPMLLGTLILVVGVSLVAAGPTLRRRVPRHPRVRTGVPAETDGSVPGCVRSSVSRSSGHRALGRIGRHFATSAETCLARYPPQSFCRAPSDPDMRISCPGTPRRCGQRPSDHHERSCGYPRQVPRRRSRSASYTGGSRKGYRLMRGFFRVTAYREPKERDWAQPQQFGET